MLLALLLVPSKQESFKNTFKTAPGFSTVTLSCSRPRDQTLKQHQVSVQSH